MCAVPALIALAVFPASSFTGQTVSGLGVAVSAALGIVFLGGLWITATHVPLIFQAPDGHPGAPWNASIFHALWGPPIAFVSLWLLWRELAAA